MPLLIIKPGLSDNIHDNGRYGYSKYGINPGGTMDRFAARLANSLVGNNADKALLEIHFPGPQALFTEDALISITGADFTPTLNEEPLPLWHPILVKKNTLLQFSAQKKGARAYLAVHAGFYVDKWLNSSSTHSKAMVGGWKGRRLEKGDELPIGFHELNFQKMMRPENNFKTLPWSPDVQEVYASAHQIQFIAGKEWSLLDEQSVRNLSSESFTISVHSDRMGYQLKGPALILKEPIQCLTSPVEFGTMQLLPDGQLIVLMADHQTTGGYPKIGHVISAHLPRLAQLSAGEKITFAQTDLHTATALSIHQLQELENLHALCIDHLNEILCAK